VAPGSLNTYQCECERLKNEENKQLKKYMFKLNKDEKYEFAPKSDEYPICKVYVFDVRRKLIVGMSISFSIIMVNTILRFSIINLVMWIGEETQS